MEPKDQRECDILVVGGGINGAGIARDAAGRGLSVILCEKDDLASHTSSASTKLIHGGLRYLEYYEFRLVREALTEREVLLRAAPHIVRPLRFVLPYQKGLRPWWMLRAGLFLYDHLGGRKILPGTRVLSLAGSPIGAPLQGRFRRAFEYSDCWVDDARMVVLNARDAASRGAEVLTRTRCARARVQDGVWVLEDDAGSEWAARVLVNAAGPWVSRFLGQAVGQNAPAAIRLVKGSHIVVRRLFDHDRCYILQNPDGRICFAIPYERDFTLIGTTDEDYSGDPADVAISPAEETYLLSVIGQYLRVPVAASDVVWRYAGVRPLHDDGSGKAQAATRDYVLELTGTPPVLSVFGGKITTSRRLAEAVMDRLQPFFPGLGAAWTASASLPGGDFAWDGVDALRADLSRRFPLVADETMRRFVRSYGTLTEDLLDGGDMGATIGADLTEREVDWLVRTEWARTAEDILWRRSKLGLRFTPADVQALRTVLR
jgi:glycerol-3-phosphate dehydrogenase